MVTIRPTNSALTEEEGDGLYLLALTFAEGKSSHALSRFDLGAVVAGCPQKIFDYTPTACSKEETITEEASGSSRPVLKATTMKAGPRTQ
ncbi:unnamed protein product [Acanthoscelides obtectus]|uniref:Uncharacterized protein n=1 Tax=Acanthoscelides obtectus TaxID=200917 RepID=A0A9P0JWN0_ACAOB|nr:unnamed protein product [Acanthoscelides obtectus]CAK1632117.1 hypothetical protein AOBTE_LOCUS7374 [Acanthoscelides obtectus]